MNTTTKKTACILIILLVILCLGSILYLLFSPKLNNTGYIAHIYVQGELYQTIPLSQVTEPYQINIPCQTGGYNTILVESNAIRITAADCPDQICVKQGSITNSLLPITCLPHNVVIELKPSEHTTVSDTPDILTH